MGSTIWDLIAKNFVRTPNTSAIETLTKEGLKIQTWSETRDLVEAAAKALIAIGVKRGDRIAILSENRAEWYTVLWAAMRIGAVAVPLYVTASKDQHHYIVKDCSIRFAFVSKHALYGSIAEIAETRFIKTVVFDSDAPGNYTNTQPLDIFIQSGADIDLDDVALPEEEDTAVLIYTSGTTGEPKGVMLSHHNIVSNVQILRAVVEHLPELRYLSILPLSHAYEFTVVHVVCDFGGTLIPVPVMAKTVEYIDKGRPTIACAVPRLFEKIFNTVMRNAEQNKPHIKRLFYEGLKLGEQVYRYLEKNEPIPFPGNIKFFFFRKLVFEKIRAKTVRSIKLFISGGAAIQPEIVRFFNIIGTPIVEGYGITECSPVVSCNLVDDRDVGTVGPPLKRLDVRITTDGELKVKGPIVMKGYYGKEHETRAVIDDEGFFYTGDLCVWTDNGKIKIIGRKKDIIVMATGKNIAPAKIENMLAADPYIDAACVAGDEKKYLSALIVPDFDAVRTWAAENNIVCANDAELMQHHLVQRLIKTSIDKVNKKIESHEIIKRFHLITHRFSVETGELTPTLKLKRRDIAVKYKDIFDSMYGIGADADSD